MQERDIAQSARADDQRDAEMRCNACSIIAFVACGIVRRERNAGEGAFGPDEAGRGDRGIKAARQFERDPLEASCRCANAMLRGTAHPRLGILDIANLPLARREGPGRPQRLDVRASRPDPQPVAALEFGQARQAGFEPAHILGGEVPGQCGIVDRGLSTLLGVGSELQFSGENDLVQAVRQSSQQNVSRG